MGRRKNKDTLFDESAALNNATFRYYADRMTELSVSMFEWKGLPDGVDVRFMEMALFTEGSAVFFYDEDLGDYLCLRSAASGRLDCYDIPTRRTAYGTGYQKPDLTNKNSVLIYNNYLHTNTYPTAILFAKRLWDLDRAVDVNAKAQKTPVAILADEKQRLTMLNLYMKYDGNQPFIFGDKTLSLDQIKAINTGAPYVADKLYNLKCNIWNEALTYLGISNVNITKKERLVSDEVQRNLGGTVASRYSRLMSRKEAAEKINKLFGLNVSVEYREDNNNIDEIDEGGAEI